MNRRTGTSPGFTLIETAVVMIVAGLIIATLMPLILKSLRQEQSMRAKAEIREARDEIIGYLLANGRLPASLDAIARNRDAFDNRFIYVTAQKLADGQSPCQLNATGLTLRRHISGADYTDYADVAFVLISPGENRNVQSGHEATRVTVFPSGLQEDYDAADGIVNQAYDDLYEFATLNYLRGRTCPPQSDNATSAPTGSDVSFAANIADFSQIAQTVGQSVVVVSQSSKEVSLGNAAPDTWGCVWYGGNAEGWCSDGACTATDGLRAFFRFRFANKDTSSDSRDYSGGFVFATLAWTNATAPCGGSGDCLGYAGIDGPKTGVEFDVYPNAVRNDYGDHNHIAGLFWGQGADPNKGTTHGGGTHNAAWGSTGYYRNDGGVTWLEDALEHTARIEIDRNNSNPSSPVYRIRTWIDCAGSHDLSVVYNASRPLITHAATLTATEAQALSTLRIGWTYGAGTSPQTVTISGFGLKFVSR